MFKKNGGRALELATSLKGGGNPSIKRGSAFHIFPDIDALYIMYVIRYERYPRTLGREVIILVNLITKYKHKASRTKILGNVM